MSEDAETHFEPASTSYGSYGMCHSPTHDLEFHVESEFKPNTMPRGTLIPHHVERFGSTSHIAPSIPAVEATSHIPARPRVSDLITIPDLRQVTIGNNTYIISQVPSSFVPSSSNVHPPPHSRGPSGRNVATSYVHIAVTRPVVSQLHVPPIVSRGHAHTSRGHIPTSRVYIPTSGAYVPTYGVSHGTSHAMTYGPYYGT